MGSTSDCGVWIAKYVLCIFNFLFFILGTIVLGTGIWLAVDKASLIALFKMVESERIHQFTQPHIIEHLAYVIIVIGALMFFLGILGYCGIMHESRCLVTFYGVLMVLLLIGEIVAGGFAIFYQNEIRNETKTYLKTTITSYYTSGQKNDAVTHMWNQMMSNFGCCGLNDYQDFDTSTSWYTSKGNRTIPEACCVLKDVKNIIPRDEDCVTNPSESNSFYRKGCYEHFSDWLISHRIVIVCVLLGVAVVHLFSIFLSFCLSKAFGKYEDMRL